MLKSTTIALLFLLGLTSNIIAQRNVAPSIVVPGEQKVRTGQSLKFTVNGSDANAGQILNFTATGLPSGATFGKTTPTQAEFSWTPRGTQTGTYRMSVRVTDNGSPVLSSPIRDINIIVENRAPVLRVTDNHRVAKGQPLRFIVSATDEDLGQVLRFSATGLPSLASFEKISATEARFDWIPTADQDGPYNATIRVEDNGSPSRVDTKRINITIKSNSSPVLTVPGAQAGTPGQPLSFSVSAVDPDEGQLMRLTAAGLPTGAIFRQHGANQGRLEWTPTGAQTGSHTIRVTVEDRGTPSLSDTKTVRVTVQNRSPEVFVPATQTVIAGSTLSYVVTAKDLDPGQSIRLEATGLPSGAILKEISSSRIEFNWTPRAAQIGTYQVTYKVTDNGSPNLSQSKSVRLQVMNLENWKKLARFDSKVTTLNDLEIWNGFLVAATNAGVYLSWEDGWLEINNGFTNLMINSLAVRGDVLYAATDSGLFSTKFYGIFPMPGYGITWYKFSDANNELSNSPVKILASRGTNVLAATDSKVFFSSDLVTNWKPIYYGQVEMLAFNTTADTVYFSKQPRLCRVSISDLNTKTFPPEENNNFFQGCVTLGPLFPTQVGAFAGNGARLIATSCGALTGPVLSFNNGENWSEGIRMGCVRSFTSVGSDLLFAGTNTGVFLSTTFGQSWVKHEPAVKDIKHFITKGNILYAGNQMGEIYQVKITGSY